MRSGETVFLTCLEQSRCIALGTIIITAFTPSVSPGAGQALGTAEERNVEGFCPSPSSGYPASYRRWSKAWWGAQY